MEVEPDAPPFRLKDTCTCTWPRTTRLRTADRSAGSTASNPRGMWKCMSSPRWFTVLMESVSSPGGIERETRAKHVMLRMGMKVDSRLLHCVSPDPDPHLLWDLSSGGGQGLRSRGVLEHE